MFINFGLYHAIYAVKGELGIKFYNFLFESYIRIRIYSYYS